MCERGDVGWAPLPGVGHKPVVVVSTRVVSVALRPVVTRITSVKRDRPLPTAVALDDGEVPGLPRRSWIVCHDLATLMTDEPIEHLGRLSPARMVDVEEGLRAVLGL